MRIVADENIPFVQEAFGSLGAVHLMSGRSISPEILRDAEVLLVRSVTRVDSSLLEGSAVRFVGSATIGTDHVDAAYLRDRGIPFAHAPGSNAESVVEYVIAALLHLAVSRNQPLRGKTVGIVGCGNIGGRLAERLPALGLTVLKNDPPLQHLREREGKPRDYIGLDDLLEASDIVTLHVPLTASGPYPTRRLMDDERLGRMRSGAWLLNSCRGAVVSGAALSRQIAGRRTGAVVLDVWEGEPEPDPLLVERVDLGTPHIAGYSYDGKVQGTVMLYDALTDYLRMPRQWNAEEILRPGAGDHPRLAAPDDAAGDETTWLAALVRQMYPISEDDRRFRGYLEVPAERRSAFFNELRKTYPRRRAFSRHRLPASETPEPYRIAVQEGLRVELTDG